MKVLNHFFLLLGLSVSLLTACSNSTALQQDSTGIDDFMEIYCSVYEPQDTMTSTYMQALSDVLDCLAENPPATAEAAELLTTAYKTIEGVTYDEFKLSDDIQSYMRTSLLSIEELTALAGTISVDQETYLDELNFLIYALDSAVPTGRLDLDDIIYEVNFQYQLYTLYVKYNYYAANEFFSVLDDNDLKYVQTYLQEHFTTCSLDDVKWQDSADEAFQMQEHVWKEIEAFVE